MSTGASVKIGLVPGGGSVGLAPEVVTFSREDRGTHTYVCGATRQGKSKLLESMIRQDIIAQRTTGSGLLVLDPHAAVVKPTLRFMARHGLDRPTIVIDIASEDWVVGLSPLRHPRGGDIDEFCRQFVESIAHVWGSGSTHETPRFQQWATNIAYALIHKGLTLAEADVFASPGRLPEKRFITRDLPNAMVAADWQRALKLKDDDYTDEIGSTARRIGALLKSDRLLRMVGQTDTIDWHRAMDEGWIVFLAFSSSTDAASSTLATMVLTGLWQAASEREKEKSPNRFHVYLDEFERFVTPSMAQSLAEAAGFGLSLTMSHQFPHQLKHAGPHGARLLDEVFNNAHSKITFKVGRDSAELLARDMFADVDTILSLQKRTFVAKAATWPASKVVETADVSVAAVSDEDLKRFVDERMASWREPFIISRTKAETNVSGRMERAMRSATARHADDPPDECATSARRARPKTVPPH